MIDTAAHPLLSLIPLAPPLRHLSRYVGSPLERTIAATKAFNDLVRAVSFFCCIFVHPNAQILLQELALVKSNVNVDEEPTCYAQAFLAEMRRRVDAGEDLGKRIRQTNNTLVRHSSGVADSVLTIQHERSDM